MKAKSIVTAVLLAFVGVSVVYLVIQEAGSPESKKLANAEARSVGSDAQTGHKLIAYYFHRTKRCETCLTIEAYAKEALRDAFPEELGTGELEWRAVNVEEPANEHFVEDYQIVSSELIFVDTHDGERKEWRNLKRVWDLVGNELEFKAYVEGEALVFLEQDS